ncbi:MAG: glycosyltransferase family 2 protein [Cyanobacteria bacterium P01_D01_bin.156]
MISIVIANYNKESFIKETIQSVINQTYFDWEIVFVDDGSTDNSIQVILELARQDPRIVVEHTQPSMRGANAARNIGWQRSKFDYILFLDSDDILAPQCIEDRLSHSRGSELDFNIFTGGTFLRKVGDRKILWQPKKHSCHLESFLRHDLPWHLTSALWTKTGLNKINGFSEELPRLQDVDLYMRALLLGLRYRVIGDEKPDFFYRVSPERCNYNAYELGERYVAACDIFQKSTYDLIQSTGYKENLKKLYIRRLRGTTLSIMYRFAIEGSKGLMTNYQMHNLQKNLRNLPSTLLVFDGVSENYLDAYMHLVNIGFWRLRGFTKLTKALIC